jgi:F-box/leucine-rich repeat protein 2/20
MSRLPYDVLSYILEFVRDVHKFVTVCKRFRYVTFRLEKHQLVTVLTTSGTFSMMKHAAIRITDPLLSTPTSLLNNPDLSEDGVRDLLHKTSNSGGVAFIVLQNCSGVVDSSLHDIPRFPGLQTLILSGCHRLNSRAFRSISKCVSLKHINISDAPRITDVALKELSRVDSLESLVMRGCKLITDGGVIALTKNCYLLRHLDVSWCRSVTDESLRALANHCPHLETLHFNSCQRITDAGLRILGKLKRLKSLHVALCQQLTDGGVSDFVEATSEHLTDLNLEGCTLLSDAAVRAMTTNCVQLRSLNLSRCYRISNVAMSYLAATQEEVEEGMVHGENTRRTLTELNCSDCSRISDVGCAALSKCTQLKKLVLGSCPLVTDIGLEHLARASHLESVNFSRCHLLSDVGVGTLVKGLGKKLHEVDFGDCVLLTDEALECLGSYAPCLRHANFCGCEDVSSDALGHLYSQMLRVKRFW